MNRELKPFLGMLIALFVLNSALSFHNVWPTPWITLRPEISVEIALLLTLLALFARSAAVGSRFLHSGIAAVLLLMTVGRYMEVTAPALYGRAVNLYWDAQHLPAVAAMITRSMPTYLVGVIALASILGFAGVYWLLRWSVAHVATAMQAGRARKAVGIVAMLVVGLYMLGYYSSLPTLRWFSIPVSQTYAAQAKFLAAAIGGPGPVLPAEQGLPAELDDANSPHNDIILTFVESYGAIAFDVPEVSSRVEDERRGLESAIRASGRQAASAFIEAPTFGGASWLSHSSFMTGYEITDGGTYNLLLTRDENTLPKLLKHAGYRVVALMPGLRGAWPEGAFYGFDVIYGRSSLDYRGPEFGWWAIPDQYSLAKLDTLELAAAERDPVFVFFPTISTHMPFRPTPPYQSDWHRLSSDSPYTPDELGDRLSEVSDLSDWRPAYADAVAYTYEYWSGYLHENSNRDLVLILIGDHQPPASVSGRDARWDVPMHVVTADAGVIDRLVESGFTRGLAPSRRSVAAMHELAGRLLGVLAGSPGSTR